MRNILCFEQVFKISTVIDVDDLFTFVNKSLNDPLNLLRILKYWTQMKALTLSYHFCSCSNQFSQKQSHQIKIKIEFSEKIQLLQCALQRQTLLIKTGPDIYVDQYWFFDSLTFFDWIKSDSTFQIFFFLRLEILETSFSGKTFDPVEKCF